MYKNIDANLSRCTGCMACSFACKSNAITFVLNNDGFYKPVVDHERCVNCGACLKHCPSKLISQTEIKSTFYGWSKDNNVRNNSSSGGAFFEIASNFILNNGVVYGASLIEYNKVEHIRICNIKELYRTQGSKYIQSNLIDCYKNISKDIKEGNKILFSGTPCQVAAVKALFPNYKNLFTIDLVCFGFISNGMYNLYMEGLQQKYKSKIKSVIFRDQKHNNKLNTTLENGKEIFCDYRDNPKTGLYSRFINKAMCKDACIDCNFRSKNRFGDITLSDYPYSSSDELDSERRGVSVIYISTNRGYELCKNINFEITPSHNLIDSFLSNKHNNNFLKNAKIFRNQYHKFANRPKLFLRIFENNVSKRSFRDRFISKIRNIKNIKIK